jgi:hypothetical protein
MPELLVSPSPPSRYHTLAEAAEAADGKEGWRILMAPGRYYMPTAVLRGKLTISAASGLGSVLLAGTDAWIIAAGGDITLEGLMLRSRPSDGGGAYVTGGSLTVQNCHVTAGRRGALWAREGATMTVRACDVHGAVVCYDESSGEITDSRVSQTPGNGVYVKGSGMAVRVSDSFVHRTAEAGIHAADGATITIENCDIAEPRYGVSVGGGSTTIRKTRIHHPGEAAVTAWGESAVTVEDCQITASARTGLRATGSATVMVRRTTVRDCAGNGINVSGAASVRVESCEVIGSSSAGICLSDQSALVMTSGLILGPDAGVLVGSGQARLDKVAVSGSNSMGVAVTGDGRAELRECTITCNNIGVQADDLGRVAVADCRFEGNTSHDRAQGKVTVTNAWGWAQAATAPPGWRGLRVPQ